MVVYNGLLSVCLQLPFQTPGMADVRVLHLGLLYFYLVLMPSMSSRNVEHKASCRGGAGRGGPGRAEGRQAGSAELGYGMMLPTLLPGTNWFAGEHRGHLWPCAGRACPLAPCLSVQAAGRAVHGTASYALSYF